MEPHVKGEIMVWPMKRYCNLPRIRHWLNLKEKVTKYLRVTHPRCYPSLLESNVQTRLVYFGQVTSACMNIYCSHNCCGWGTNYQQHIYQRCVRTGVHWIGTAYNGLIEWMNSYSWEKIVFFSKNCFNYTWLFLVISYNSGSVEFG